MDTVDISELIYIIKLNKHDKRSYDEILYEILDKYDDLEYNYG